ncbi:terminase gpA endonuclease subunit [Pelosinus sp. IPA-1]|uniref:phage terminase large subunit family protein n=1 Tax=Pelosinus sp. IPA-1 TaxID=3029569 RepID=UPI00243621C3|nr:terminase gpA endonuclease subunit [Pelosinus sp. IPA-1]GMB00424.1 terminase [Pelosinus sp. IPA-1]
MNLAKTRSLFAKVLKKALAPIPKMSVSEWADKFRVLSSEASAEPGRWRTDRAPYQRAIMDAFTTSKIWKVVVKSASQIGKSDIMNNVLGRFAHIDPGPIMMIQPTIELAEDYSKSRISPMLRDTKVLANLFADVKAKISGNTILSKLFPGGRLIMCGANSPSGLASRPIRVLLADEVDRFPDSAGTEGDPVELAAKRMTTFWNKIMGLFSTPTIKGASRIDTEYMAGTQEEWQHKCPGCGELHLVTHRNIDYEHTETINSDGTKFVIVLWVKWRCPDCGKAFTQAEMAQTEQEYVMQNPAALENGIRSFFVNCFASPWIKWDDVMREYLEAKGVPEREKVVYNTRFGESYEAKGAIEDADIFLRRREDYGAELPDGVLLLTAAVDTQDNRLEYEICGWGVGEENWGIRKGVIWGVPDMPEVWKELDEQLDRTYRFINGTGLIVARTLIDSGGHYTKEVYEYCQRNFRKGRFAIKGMGDVAGLPLIYKFSKVPAYGIPLIMLGVDSGKQYVMDRLQIEEPGQKYFHFPLDAKGDEGAAMTARGYDRAYFNGMIAERLVPRIRKGKRVMVWENVSSDKRNEPLDLRVYNLANLQTINPNWEKYRQALGLESADEQPKKTEQKGPPKKQQQYGCIRRSSAY